MFCKWKVTHRPRQWLRLRISSIMGRDNFWTLRILSGGWRKGGRVDVDQLLFMYEEKGTKEVINGLRFPKTRAINSSYK